MIIISPRAGIIVIISPRAGIMAIISPRADYETVGLIIETILQKVPALSL